MNEQKVTELINQTITNLHKEIGGKAARKQYAPAKHQIKKLTELGILHLMPQMFGHSDAKAVIETATDNGKTVGGFNAYGEGDVTTMTASALYQALNS